MRPKSVIQGNANIGIISIISNTNCLIYWRFSIYSSPVTAVIGSSILIATLALQIYAICRIAYCKWNYRSNEVVIFVLPDETNRENVANTRSYNEILFDLAPMVFLGVVTMVCGSGRLVYRIYGLPENYQNVSSFFLYYYEFSELFIMQVGFPLLFYFFHPKARNYVRETLFCK